MAHDYSHRTHAALKGAAAEVLIEGILTTSGFRVKRRGQEWRTLQGDHRTISKSDFRKAHRSRKEAVAPDFVILHEETGRVAFVEVKYSAGGLNSVVRRSVKVMAKYWPRALFVLAEPNGNLTLFYPPFLDQYGRFMSLKKCSLFEAKGFKINPDWKEKAAQILRVIEQFGNGNAGP